MSFTLPLRNTRLAVLTLAEISSIIASAASVNAIAKSNDEKKALRRSLPPGTSMTISTTDIEDTIIVLYVVTLILAMQAGNFLALLAKDWLRPYWPPSFTHPRNGIPISTRTLTLQSWYLLLSVLATLIVLVPATVFAVHRAPDIRLFQGGMQLPQSMIQPALDQLGLSNVYWTHFPFKFMIITNWINLLFNIMAVPPSFVARSRREASFPMSNKLGDSPPNGAPLSVEEQKHAQQTTV